MDNIKIGKLIYTLRKEKKLTQLQLAECMNISDKTISKWERGLGCPDVSLLSELSKLFEVDLEKLLSGKLDINETLGGSLKQRSRGKPIKRVWQTSPSQINGGSK